MMLATIFIFLFVMSMLIHNFLAYTFSAVTFDRLVRTAVVSIVYSFLITMMVGAIMFSPKLALTIIICLILIMVVYVVMWCVSYSAKCFTGEA
jgi:hypothetical protein